MTDKINHTQAFMNLITLIVILGGLGILWGNFLEWLNEGKQTQKSTKVRGSEHPPRR